MKLINTIVEYRSMRSEISLSDSYSYVYKRNYLSCQEKLGKVSVMMETKARSKKTMPLRRAGNALPVFNESCNFEGYDVELLTNKTEKLRELITIGAQTI